MTRRLTLTLTEAEAKALLDAVNDALIDDDTAQGAFRHSATIQAAKRAADKLSDAIYRPTHSAQQEARS